MARLRPGWLVALWATGLSISAWLPWLTSAVGGGGRASAIGGSLGSVELPPRFGAGQLIVLLSSVLIVLGAILAHSLAPRLAGTAAVVISALIAVLTWWYYRSNVIPPVDAGYGFYLGAAFALAALVCSAWALVSALFSE